MRFGLVRLGRERLFQQGLRLGIPGFPAQRRRLFDQGADIRPFIGHRQGNRREVKQQTDQYSTNKGQLHILRSLLHYSIRTPARHENRTDRIVAGQPIHPRSA